MVSLRGGGEIRRVLALEFPPSPAEWVFFVASAVILLWPLVVERLGRLGSSESSSAA